MTSAPLVWLRGGMVVPLDALRLAWKLEDKGFRFRLHSDGGLLVAPFDRLTPEDYQALRTWRRHIAALVRYCDHDVRSELEAAG